MSDRQVSSPPRGSPRRTDPVLGSLDQIDPGADRRPPAGRTPPPEPPRRKPPKPRRGPRAGGHRGLWIAALVVVVLAGAGAWAWTNQATLRSWLPPTQLNTLLTRADNALAAGDLVDGPGSARSLYEAARALDPDNERALDGLHAVGKAELARAKEALAKRDYATARSALEQARSLLGGGAEVAALDQALAKAVLHSANIDVLLDQARAALANGRVDGEGGAADLYAKVLAGDPHNAVARHGMSRVGNVLAARVHTQLGKDDRAGAKKTLGELARLLPGYAELPSLRAAVAAADRDAATRRDQALARGDAYLRAGKVTGEGDDNALAQFKAALAADPDSARAKAGLGQVATALIVQANAAIDAGQPRQASGLLDQAAALAPESADLAAARSRLADAQAGAQDTGGPDTTPAQSAKVARLVARADAAARKGDIMLPPGGSAYDLYRAALAIDAGNTRAQAGLRALPAAARKQFQQALHGGDLDHAHDMLATLDQLDPDDPAASTMRRSLGSAWLDRAERDARLGRAAAAREALAEAKRLVPHDPRLAEVGARISRND